MPCQSCLEENDNKTNYLLLISAIGGIAGGLALLLKMLRGD